MLLHIKTALKPVRPLTHCSDTEVIRVGDVAGYVGSICGEREREGGVDVRGVGTFDVDCDVVGGGLVFEGGEGAVDEGGVLLFPMRQ